MFHILKYLWCKKPVIKSIIDLTIEKVNKFTPEKFIYTQSSDLSTFNVYASFTDVETYLLRVKKASEHLSSGTGVSLSVYAVERSNILISKFFQSKTGLYVDYNSIGRLFIEVVSNFLLIYQEKQNEINPTPDSEYNIRVLMPLVEDTINLIQILDERFESI